MNITLNIQAGSPTELQEAIAFLAGIVGGTIATPPVVTQEEKPKRGSRTTAKPEKQQEPVKEDPEATDSEPPEPESIPSVVELRAAAQTKGATPEGRTAIKALLDEFGSKSISDVPEEKRAAFLARLEAL